jgi:hypothetical protein
MLSKDTTRVLSPEIAIDNNQASKIFHEDATFGEVNFGCLKGDPGTNKTNQGKIHVQTPMNEVPTHHETSFNSSALPQKTD